jgi:oxalate decarboxylase/phosphoglucose isomerase-like protein (cupin superfamily)
MLTVVTRKELKDVFMDQKSSGVKEPYFLIQGEGGQNITVITPGLNGIEFNKTFGHFHTYPEVEIYNVVYGQGVLLMQRNDEDGEAKEIRIVGLRPGSTVEVPAGYGHTIVNVGKNYLVVIDNAPQNQKSDNIEVVRSRHGLAYYIVDKKGEVGFEPNPNYHLHPQITTY